jgi:signal transduction histidine kinase
LPAAAVALVGVEQVVALTLFRSQPGLQLVPWEVLLYATLGPLALWFGLSWFAHWVRKRDEAEAYLRHLSAVSRQAVAATDTDTLVDIALDMPGQVVSPVAVSLIVRDHPEGSWQLAGTRQLSPEARQALEAHLISAGADLACGTCTAWSAAPQQDCTLRAYLPQASLGTPDCPVICLPLSTEHPPLALLNVYLLTNQPVSPAARQALESMAASLAAALDSARLRGRQIEMLQRMQQAVHGQQGLAAALSRILADIVGAYRAELGELYQVVLENGESKLAPVASWPAEGADCQLIAFAQQALQTGEAVAAAGGRRPADHVVAVPLAGESLPVGALALAGRRPFSPGQTSFLRGAAGMMGLLIRNSQLYAELESQAVLGERARLAREVHDGLGQSLGFLNFKVQQIDRLLARDQWEPARQALQEMRKGLQDLYAEVRLTIEDLRWFSGEDLSLAGQLRAYVAAIAGRTGLEISLVVDGEPDLSRYEQIHLFRIAQEALANVRKHARAQHAWVRLVVGSQGTTLEVEDDGKGLPAQFYPDVTLLETPGHFGVRIIKERAAAIGGQVSLHSSPAGGTRLRVAIPDVVEPARTPAGGADAGLAQEVDEAATQEGARHVPH